MSTRDNEAKRERKARRDQGIVLPKLSPNGFSAGRIRAEMRGENRVQRSQAITSFERQQLANEQWKRDAASARVDVEKRAALDKWRAALR